MLCDLCHFLGPDLSLMDGIWAMEGNGPTGGQRRDLHVIAGSESPWALDVAAASLVGLEPEKIVMLREGHERGYGPLDLSELAACGGPHGNTTGPGLFKAEAIQHGLYRPAAEILAAGCEEIGHALSPHRQKAVRGPAASARRAAPSTPFPAGRKAVIRYQNCIRCFCCHEMCPKHVVQIKRLGCSGCKEGPAKERRTMKRKAYAKINLTLDITGRRRTASTPWTP